MADARAETLATLVTSLLRSGQIQNVIESMEAQRDEDQAERRAAVPRRADAAVLAVLRRARGAAGELTIGGSVIDVLLGVFGWYTYLFYVTVTTFILLTP